MRFLKRFYCVSDSVVSDSVVSDSVVSISDVSVSIVSVSVISLSVVSRYTSDIMVPHGLCKMDSVVMRTVYEHYIMVQY